MKKENFCDIYVARIPSGEVGFAPLCPEAREKEVSGVKNERVRREKYFVWRLFEHALKNSLGVDIEDLKIEKNPNGKWVAEGINFSLSHGGDALAIALSSHPVGIDIEPLSAVKNENISRRILTADELLEYAALADEDKREYIIKKWTAKEAIFKSQDEATFSPEHIEVSEHNVAWCELMINGEKYIAAVSGEQIEKINVFENAKI